MDLVIVKVDLLHGCIQLDVNFFVLVAIFVWHEEFDHAFKEQKELVTMLAILHHELVLVYLLVRH